MKILGIDPSLTGTAVAMAAGTDKISTGQRRGVERLIYVRDEVLGMCRATKPDLVVLEHYSFNSRNQGEFMGELGGVLRVALQEACFPFVDVPPASLKKFASGSGNASKDAVCMAVCARLGRTFPDNDHVDAYVLRQMALAAYGQEPELQVPAAQRETLSAVPWPVVPTSHAAHNEPMEGNFTPVVTYKPKQQKKGRAA